MARLKQFYTEASQIILDAAVSDVEVVIHDAFWGPNYWSGYDPLSDTSSSSPDWLQLDTHQYYAFAPYQNLPRQEILQNICNMSRILKSTTSRIAPIVVGEWSLESGSPPNWTGTSSGGLTREKRTWFRTLFEAQLAAYSPNGLNQPSRGWYYWTWKTQCEFEKRWKEK
ncbi:glycoside hydrolase superfamily [Mrakia frigida]|uniref:glycoside hydrolase superfamily n=1 Tax=Mrakia frigida TaxID=29902 RepID=UPI003FCBF7BB